MSDRISMMNPGVGINAVNLPRNEEMPRIGQRSGGAPALSMTGNEKGLETYDGTNMDSIVDRYLQPQSEDPELMSSHVFQRTVQTALDKLAKLADGDVGVSQLGAELAQNNEIVRMYTSLVIPG